MASLSSASVRPLSLARARWPRSCSVLPFVISAATVIRLRSLLDSSVRSPDVAKQNVVGERDQLRCEVADRFLRWGQGLRVGHFSFSFMIRNAAGA